MGNAPLKILSSMATRELLAEMAADYQRQHAQSLLTEAAGGMNVIKRLQNGEAADIVVLAVNAIDQLIAEGRLRAGRVDLVKSGVAEAVRQGAALPDISDAAAVKHAVSHAASIGYSTGPSGTYLEKLFDRWGILSQIRSRIVTPPPGVPVGTLVAGGECELGFQQLSELMTLPGITVVGPLPAEIQTMTIFSGAVSMLSREPETAAQVLAAFAAPATAATKLRHGMEQP